jgi:hypothetical protein
MATVVEKKSREEEILSEIGASIDASIDRMTPKNLKRHAKHAARIRKVAAARRSKRESDKARETGQSSAQAHRA